MRFSVASVLAFASAVLAQTSGFDVITEPTKNEAVPAGKTFTIVWEPTTSVKGTVTLSLLGGKDAAHLLVLNVIKSNVSSAAGKFDWAVPATLGDQATYGIEISLDSDPTTFQYSFPFTITGGGAASSSSSTDSSTTTETSSSTDTTSPPSTTVTSTTASSNLTTKTTSSASKSKTVTTSTATATKTGTTATAVATNNARAMGGSVAALAGGVALALFAL